MTIVKFARKVSKKGDIMFRLKYLMLAIGMISMFTWGGEERCDLPGKIAHIASRISLKDKISDPDILRNRKRLRDMCLYRVEFEEGAYRWKMLLVFNPQRKKGPFWYLPHDNENSAFDAAVYAMMKYGGGFLAVRSGGNRYFKGQDPNRNFGDDARTARVCPAQRTPAPLYSRNVFGIIDSFRSSSMPYLALHNNSDGWRGNGGRGGISILKKSDRVLSYPAYKNIKSGRKKGLQDEDSMVYIAGRSSSPPASVLKRLHKAGLNVKYEIVDRVHNDCSMSNYVVLKKRSSRYYNIESEHGDTATQIRMIDRLLRAIK